MEVEDSPLEDSKQVVFHFHVSSRESRWSIGGTVGLSMNEVKEASEFRSPMVPLKIHD